MLSELPPNVIVWTLGFLELRDVVRLDSASCSASSRQYLHEAFELNSVDYGVYKGDRSYALTEWLCKRGFRSNEISITVSELSSFLRIPNYGRMFASYSDIALLGLINERLVNVVFNFLSSLPIVQSLHVLIATYDPRIVAILIQRALTQTISLDIIDDGSGVLGRLLSYRSLHLLIDRICYEPIDDDTVSPHIQLDPLSFIGFNKLTKLVWISRSSACLNALLEHSPLLENLTIAGGCCTPTVLTAISRKRLTQLDLRECDRNLGANANPLAMPANMLSLLQASRNMRTSCHHTLHSIRLEGIRTVDMEYRHLTGLVNLQSLSLIGCIVRTTEIMPVLTAFPYFRLLELSYLTGLSQAFYASKIIRMRDDEELILAVDDDEFAENDDQLTGLLSILPTNNIESKVRMRSLELHLAHHDDLRDEAMVNQIFTMLCSVRSTLFSTISTFHHLRKLQLVEAPVRHFHLLNLRDCCPLLESLHLTVDPGNIIFPQVTFCEFPQRWRELKTIELLHGGCFPSGLRSLVTCGAKLKNVTVTRVMDVSVEAWQLLLGTLKVEFRKVNIKLIPDLDDVVGPLQPLAVAEDEEVSEAEEEAEEGFEDYEAYTGNQQQQNTPQQPNAQPPADANDDEEDEYDEYDEYEEEDNEGDEEDANSDGDRYHVALYDEWVLYDEEAEEALYNRYSNYNEDEVDDSEDHAWWDRM